MISADKLDRTGWKIAMGVLGPDESIIIDIESMPLPGATFRNDMQEREMTVGTIREIDAVHGLPPGYQPLCAAV
jgi:hypothetical protein